jgi:hypothetical protein
MFVSSSGLPRRALYIIPINSIIFPISLTDQSLNSNLTVYHFRQAVVTTLTGTTTTTTTHSHFFTQ